MRTPMVKSSPPDSALSAKDVGLRQVDEFLYNVTQASRGGLQALAQGSEGAMSIDSHDNEIARALAGIRNRLDTLASINAENILIPGGPQERYHQIVEEAYAALGLLETQVDELRAELEYQHTRLDVARDAALAQAIQEQE